MPGRSGQYAVICLQIFSISKANTNLSLGHTILVPDKLWQGQNECCEAVSEKNGFCCISIFTSRYVVHLNPSERFESLQACPIRVCKFST
jgi:hypothetical protein